MSEEKYLNGLKLVNELINDFPDNQDLKLKKGFILFKLKKYDDSIEILELISKKFNKIDKVFYYIGKCNFMKKKYEYAIKYFKKAINFNSKDPNYFLNIASTLEEIENKEDEIKKNYMKAIETNPKYSYIFLKKLKEKDNKFIINIFKETLEELEKSKKEENTIKKYFVEKIFNKIS